jgi:hypothetical protein
VAREERRELVSPIGSQSDENLGEQDKETQQRVPDLREQFQQNKRQHQGAENEEMGVRWAMVSHSHLVADISCTEMPFIAMAVIHRKEGSILNFLDLRKDREGVLVFFVWF